MSLPSVLVIDDDEEICREVVAGLAQRGYPARWTSDPLLGDHSLTPTPAVLILDLGMPKADGFEVIRRLSQEPIPPQLIVASGQDPRIRKAAVRSAEELGVPVLGTLEKPYSLRALSLLIERWRAAAPRQSSAASRLLKAAQDGTLIEHVQVAFQSKRRLADQAPAGYEALLRLDIEGPVNPELLASIEMPMAAQLAVTEVVLDWAAAFAAAQARAAQNGPISVNASPAMVCSDRFQGIVARALDRWSISAASLTIELTEHNSEASFADLAAAASRLAMLGIGVAIDDFGRGTTSYEKLMELPLSELKIDKEIFWNVVSGTLSAALIEEVIRFGHANGIQSTIEGIETETQVSIARRLGADYGQGYFWDKPQLFEVPSAPAEIARRLG
jgi:EAL domain-containing protein (putative c-di-GMP-specific phosphodiesterase class I)